jgi:hypothetical protein
VACNWLPLPVRVVHPAVTVAVSEHPSTAGHTHVCFICVTCPHEGVSSTAGCSASRWSRAHVDPSEAGGCFPRVQTPTVSGAGLLRQLQLVPVAVYRVLYAGSVCPASWAAAAGVL